MFRFALLAWRLSRGGLAHSDTKHQFQWTHLLSAQVHQTTVTRPLLQRRLRYVQHLHVRKLLLPVDWPNSSPNNLKRVVFRWYLLPEVTANDRDLRNDVVAHFRDLCKEEQREDAGSTREARSGEPEAISSHCVDAMVVRRDRVPVRERGQHLVVGGSQTSPS